MQEGPYIPETSLLDIEILLNGKDMGLSTLLKKAEVHYELNKIPYAKLVFLSTNPNVKNEDELKSGSIKAKDPIEIKTNAKDGPKTIFKGIVTKLKKRLNEAGAVEIHVDCKDRSIDLTGNTALVPSQTFGDNMVALLKERNIKHTVEIKNWEKENVSKTPNTTPWDYLLSYLDSLGFMTTIKNGVFSVCDITNPKNDIKYIAQNGTNVFDFEGKEETEESVSGVVIRYWNFKANATEEEECSTVSATNKEKGVKDTPPKNSEIITSNLGYKRETICQILKARTARNDLSRIKGNVKTFGNLKASYGEYITFEKISEKMDGELFLISEEHHTIENGCWDTRYNFGVENGKTFAESILNSTTSNEAKMGQANRMHGMQVGIVTQLEGDLEGEFRIKVRIPAIATTGDGVWARLSSIQAGGARGGFFIPEVNDEVVLGCFNGNPDTPVILGKLYSSAAPPPFDIKSENFKQGIVSKEETRIVINDEDKSIEISTKKGNKLLISDGEEGLVLEDESKNKILMNADGITLDSTKDIVLKAKGNIEIDGVKNTLNASANLELTGTIIKLN